MRTARQAGGSICEKGEPTSTRTQESVGSAAAAERHRVLVVDDDAAPRLLLKRFLQARGHDVVLARDGQEAWDRLEEGPTPLVITDWMMPGLDGPDLCRRLRARDSDDYVYVLLLSSRDQKADVLEALQSGADDFLTKPIDPAELDARLRVGERILDLQVRLAERNHRLEETNRRLDATGRRMEADLRAAARLQRSLLPERSGSVHGVRFEWLFAPSSIVAGDFFNVFALDDRRVGFFLLDVAGHGVAAALLSVALSKILTPGAGTSSPLMTGGRGSGGTRVATPGEVAAELNRRFAADDDTMSYFTMVYGVLDSVSRELDLVQCGHPPPVLMPAEGQARLLGDGGSPLGLLSEIDCPRVKLRLHAGDRLAVYSDGITECEDARGRALSEAGLLTLLKATEAASLSSMLRRLEGELARHRGGRSFDDDVSLLALELP